MMLALDLNLATRPFKNNTLLWTGYVSGLVLLVAFSAWNVMTWRDHVRRLDELQTTVGSIEGQMADLERREAAAQAGIERFDQKALRIQSFKANDVIEWRVFSWTRLFNLMERIQPNNVRMTSIRPLFRAGRRADELGTADQSLEKAVPVSVEGMAKDYAAFLELQDAMQRDGQIVRVLPERLQYTDTREIVFDLTFVYDPAGAETAAAGDEPSAVASAEDGGPEPPSDGGPQGSGATAPEGPAAAPETQPPGAVAVEEESSGEPAAEAAEGRPGAGPDVELASDAQPSPPRRKPLAKGRAAAKAKRGEQP